MGKIIILLVSIFFIIVFDISWINAVVFMLATSIVWVPLAACFVIAAFPVGWIILVIIIGLGIFALANSIFGFLETSQPFLTTLIKLLGKLFGQIPETALRMWDWGIIVPNWLWEFARYDHPWIAFIAIILILGLAAAKTPES
jgi:hypothetical protein